MNCMSMDSIIEVFYHLNKMLIATKHIADNNSVCALTHLVCNNLSISLFQTYHPTAQMSLVNPTDYKSYRVIQ